MSSKNVMATLSIVLGIATFSQLANAVDMRAIQLQYDRDDKIAAIEERIKPVGQVHVRLVSTTQPSETISLAEKNVVATPATAATVDGAKIYNNACMACHLTGAAGAPKLGDSSWAARIKTAKGTEGGFLAIVKKGKGTMPPMGMCATCSDADLQAAIDYMLKK